MQSFLENLSVAAAIASALLAIFGVFAAIVNGLHKTLSLPDIIRAYRYKPRYILLPTPDELARYCVKETAAVKLPTDDELREEWRGLVASISAEHERITRLRIQLLMTGVFLVYFMFMSRLVLFGLMSE